MQSPSRSFANNRESPIAQYSAETWTSSLQRTIPYLAHSISPAILFTLLISIRILAALFSPIADCDETFNYWEPMHYLLHRYGFQTWEYSPQFALRSYAYLYPYALIAKLADYVYSFLNVTLGFSIAYSPKIFAFYAVRVSLAVITSSAEFYLFTAVRRRYTNFIANLLFIFLISSPGMFRSSVEFLPSTFSMIFLTIALAAWMDNYLFLTIFCVAVATLLGWIFSVLLTIPMVMDVLFRKRGIWLFSIYAAVSGAMVIAIMTLIDTYHYGVLTLAPLNHILYNVFPKEGAGSQIFGEDSWTFYAKNLTLNCNIALLLYLSFPLLMACVIAFPEYNRVALKQRLRFLSGSYIAVGVFLVQPHKEERFLVPAYPCIALVAAVGINDWLRLLEMISLRLPFFKRHARRITSCLLAFVFIPLLVFNVLLGASRITMQIKSFYAPLKIYEHLSTTELRNGIGPLSSEPTSVSKKTDINICIGSEWYRFPTNFFLPHKRFKARFTASGFKGLLPKPFRETKNGTRVIPSGMNEFNKADPHQLFNWDNETGCHYFVHLDISHRKEDSFQQQSSLPIPEGARHVVHREPFLDSEESHKGFRAYYVPGYIHKLVYAEYQLVRNTKLLPFLNQRLEPLDAS